MCTAARCVGVDEHADDGFKPLIDRERSAVVVAPTPAPEAHETRTTGSARDATARRANVDAGR